MYNIMNIINSDVGYIWIDVRDIGSIPLGQEVSLEEGTAAHSSILTWRIPWTEELGRIQSMGSERVRHDWSDLAHKRVLQEFLAKHVILRNASRTESCGLELEGAMDSI